MKTGYGRLMILTLCALVTGLFISTSSQATTKTEINASVKVAKQRFLKEVKGASEYLKVAKGVLVMPNVAKAGFVVGGQYGTGALEVGGKTVGYYNVGGASFGFQAGAEKFDLVIIFVTDEALKKFQNSKGWETGVDAEINIIGTGAEGTVSTLQSQTPVVGFVLDQKGLMGGVSLKGAKFSKFQPK
jgi:lipid-binding SYLF domain-containing protein